MTSSSPPPFSACAGFSARPEAVDSPGADVSSPPSPPGAAVRAAGLESSVTERRDVWSDTSPACMTMHPQSLSTATLTMSGLVKPVTSLRIEAPSLMARRATSG